MAGKLFSELGHRWLDLKRTGTVDAVMSVQCPEFQQGCPLAFQLTASSTDNTKPAWSPDGSKLLFVSSRITPQNPNGKKQLFLIDPSRAESVANPAVQISDGTADDDDPAWNPKVAAALRLTVSTVSVPAGVVTPTPGVVTVMDNSRTPVQGADEMSRAREHLIQRARRTAGLHTRRRVPLLHAHGNGLSRPGKFLAR